MTFAGFKTTGPECLCEEEEEEDDPCHRCEGNTPESWQIEIVDAADHAFPFIGQSWTADANDEIDPCFGAGETFVPLAGSMTALVYLGGQFVNFDVTEVDISYLNGFGAGCSWTGLHSHDSRTWDCLEPLTIRLNRAECHDLLPPEVRSAWIDILLTPID